MNHIDDHPLHHEQKRLQDALDEGCTDTSHTHIADYRRALAEFLRRQHAAVYNDAGRHTADGILIAADKE